MAFANKFVVSIALFLSLAAFISGHVYGALNGVLEMDGFKDTFRYLYGYNGTTQDSIDANFSANSDAVDTGKVCSSGNGAGLDALIGLIVSMVSVGAIPGALVAGWLSDYISRKYTLAASGVVMMLGGALTSTSVNYWMLLSGQFLQGVAMGIMYMVMPVYISEISPKEHRGTLTSTIGPAFTFGVLFGLALNIGAEKFPLGWRMTFAVIGLMGLVYAIGMLFHPHTPRWLVKRGRVKEALSVLTRINWDGNKETFVETCLELKELQAATTADSEQSYSVLFKELFHCKYRVLLSAYMFITTCFSGQFSYFYSTSFFCKVDIPPFYASLVLGIVVSASAILSAFTVDKIGRKPLFLSFTMLQITVGLSLAVLVLLDLQSDAVAYIVVLLFGSYAFGHSSSWLTLSWVVSSEIFPTNIRGITVGISSGIFWLFSAIVSQLTPTIVGSPLQLHGFFFIVIGFSIVGFFVILLVLPETKGVSLEEMNTLFSQSIWERTVGYMRCGQRIRRGRQLSGMELKVSEVHQDLDEKKLDNYYI